MPVRRRETAPQTLARLFQSFWGQMSGQSSFKICFEPTGGSFKFHEAEADGLATFADDDEEEEWVRLRHIV